ncbi:MAG: hypothetical protein PHO89_02850, partial [Methylacidiphilaceae bacterium]|nr:hypothetical protein [Candidatus Methylacidiphilaceae bacterium]
KRRELFALAPGQGQEPQKKQQANNRNGQIICSQSGQFDMSSTVAEPALLRSTAMAHKLLA